MADAGSIWIRLGLNTDEFSKGLGKAKQGLVEWRDQINQNSSDMLRWGAAIGVVTGPFLAAGYAIYDLTSKAAALGKEIKDNARDLGLSTEQYQRWSHAAIAAGSSAGEIQSAIRMLSIRLREAKDPASDISRYLTALGVSALDAKGNLRPMNDLLLEILPALNRLPEGMDRNQAAMVLFGRGFSNIADLVSLSRSELQKFMDQAPVISDEKIAKMDAFNSRLATMSEKANLAKADIGTKLIPVVENLLYIIDEKQPSRGGLNAAIDYGIERLNEMIFMTQYAIQAWSLIAQQPFSGKSNEQLNKEMREWIAAYKANWESIVSPKSMLDEEANKRWKSIYGDSLTSQFTVGGKPEDSKENLLTATEIAQKQNDIKSKLIDQKEAQKDIENIQKNRFNWAVLEVKTQEEYNTLLEKAKLKYESIGLSIQKLNEELAKSGAPTTATATGLTYNEMFKSSLQTGRVGPDTAGFSELANMSEAQLAEIAKGGLGKSQAMAEKAQSYLDRMRAGGSKAGETKKEIAAKPGSDGEVKQVKANLDEQATAFQTLSDKIKSIYGEMQNNSLQTYTNIAKIAQIADENIMKNWADTLNWVNSHIAYQQIITVTDGEASATPMNIAAVSPPALTTADFSSVGVPAEAKSAATEQGTNSDVDKNRAAGSGTTINQSVTIVSPQGTPQQNATALKQANRSLGELVQSNGLGGGVLW